MKSIVFSVFWLCCGMAYSAELVEILPSSTQAFVMLSDTDLAVHSFKSAGGGQSPVAFEDLFAISLEDLANLAVGATLRAQIALHDGTAGEVVLTRSDAGARAILKQIQQRALAAGTQVESKKLGDIQVDILRRKSSSGREMLSVHVEKRGLVLLSNSLAAADAIVKQIAPGAEPGLVGQAEFDGVWRYRLPSVDTRSELEISWYVEPWQQLKNQSTKSSGPASSSSALSFARRYGMDGITAIGGSAVIGATSHVQESQWFAWSPEPLVATLAMANSLTESEKLAVPAWVSRSASQVLVAHGDVARAFDSVGPLFDDGFAGGVQGTYQDVLTDLKEILGLDLKQQLFPLLGPDVVFLVGHSSDEREWSSHLVAFEASHAPQVAQILKQLIADDPAAQEIVLEGESNRLWLVPGEPGTPDFVLGMLRGYAVYSNDLSFAKSAMRFDHSPPLLNPGVAANLIRQTAQRIKQHACLLWVHRGEPAAGSNSGSAINPLELAFGEVDVGWTAQRATWAGGILPPGLARLMPEEAVVAGFKQPQGWLFVSPELASPETKKRLEP